MTWGAVVSWLVAAEIVPVDAAPEIQASLVAGSVPIASGLLYALVRWTGSNLPVWLRRIVLGSAVPPTYARP